MLKASDIKYLLMEAQQRTIGRRTIMNPISFVEILAEDAKWNRYISTFASTMDQKTAQEFRTLCNNTRKYLLEQAVTGNISYYETLTFPILSVFYPRLVAREMVTVSPINKPEVIKVFIRPKFKKYGSTTYEYGPVYSDASKGLGPTAGALTINVGTPVNLINEMGVDPNIATVQRGSLSITKVFDDVGGKGNSVDVTITPTVDGLFSASVTINNKSDVLHGSIDWKSGTLVLSSVHGVVKSVALTFVLGHEYNLTSTRIEFDYEKIRLVVTDRQITGTWSLQFEQDVRALYDIDFQSQLIAVIGEQIALDIDKEIITHIDTLASAQPTHVDTFYKTPPANFNWGRKEWYKNVLLKLETLAATIYKDTNIGVANVIAINPVQASVFIALDDFVYTHTDNYAEGRIGYQEATIAGGKYKVLVSPVVPENVCLLCYVPDVETKVAYYYCPYIPAVVHPYPLMNVPTLSFLTRYAKAAIRPAAFAKLIFSEAQAPSQ